MLFIVHSSISVAAIEMQMNSVYRDKQEKPTAFMKNIS